LTLRGGIIVIRENGRFTVGDNRNNSTNGKPFTFAYDALAANFENGPTPGLVRFASPLEGRSFTARLNVSPYAKDSISNQTASNLVFLLISTGKLPNGTALFTDDGGNVIVRTINGVLVPLNAGDFIISDDENGVVYGDNTRGGGDFKIKPDGTRENL
jgi:hypothetical protein